MVIRSERHHQHSHGTTNGQQCVSHTTWNEQRAHNSLPSKIDKKHFILHCLQSIGVLFQDINTKRTKDLSVKKETQFFTAKQEKEPAEKKTKFAFIELCFFFVCCSSFRHRFHVPSFVHFDDSIREKEVKWILLELFVRLLLITLVDNFYNLRRFGSKTWKMTEKNEHEHKIALLLFSYTSSNGKCSLNKETNDFTIFWRVLLKKWSFHFWEKILSSNFIWETCVQFVYRSKRCPRNVCHKKVMW